MKKNLLVNTFIGLLLAGCSLTPELKKEVLDTPTNYETLDGSHSLSVGITPSNRALSNQWWEDFGDSNLNLLVEEALRKNTDYAIAASRVLQARAVLGMANADFFPTIGYNGNFAQNQYSADSDPRGMGGGSVGAFSLSAVLSYEIDLWGRVRESSKAATASLLAIAANQETVRLSVISGVIDTYFLLLNLENQRKILESTVKTYEESYQYRLKQYQVGGIEEIVLQQSKVQLESAKANLYAIIRQKSEVVSSLSILLGRSAREIVAGEMRISQSLPSDVPVVPLATPSTLISHRPDIKMAEENLLAANHSIGVAKASYFPILSLSALAGLSSSEMGKLFGATTGSVGLGVQGPIYDFGKTSNRVLEAEAKKEEALINYRATIAKAFSEVKDALVARENSEKRLNAIIAQAKSQERVYQIAKTRFEAGYTTHLELLDAERGWLSVQLELSVAKADLLSSALSIYKALGGGFEARRLEEKTMYERP
ncbi:efflux transporter outer membrane subunit [Helicobacter monodelphidis]|uniref:efflux transporter outer membrane subunit n=1 Tax=Helicobacter sp. 15-1451 TaxID=2004995 RepID=UPI0015EC8C71|nr:efflux transporter outer membrane subunit [Helicobacter sp. 15-1451]